MEDTLSEAQSALGRLKCNLQTASRCLNFRVNGSQSRDDPLISFMAYRVAFLSTI